MAKGKVLAFHSLLNLAMKDVFSGSLSLFASVFKSTEEIVKSW